VRISELADHVGVASSTVRYYERVGLLAAPARTASGYRDYDETDAARLLFARQLLAASVMAAPAAIIFSKILIPETEASETLGSVQVSV
jgi:hypothetical protein